MNSELYPRYYNATNIAEELKPAVIEKIRSIPVKYPEIREEWEEIINHINFKEGEPDAWRRFKTYNKNLDKSRNQSFEELFPEETKLYKIVI